MGQNRGGANRELEGVRRELFAGYSRKGLCGGRIGIKRVGELDIKPFFDECKKRFPVEQVALRKAVQLKAIWQKKLSNPDFHPVHVVTIHDKPQAFMESDDESLYWLKQKWGDELCYAVVSAYIELIMQNSGRKIVSELWNFKRKRRATLTEATKHIISDRKEGRRDEIEELRKLLAQRDEQIEFLKKNTLKECPNNKAIQELRKELLDVFPQRGSGVIQVRETGSLDFEPFKEAFKNTLPRQVADYRAAELYSKWEAKLRDPTWHPFKIVDVNGEPEAILNKYDKTLNVLNDEWGEDITNAVIHAYVELDEENPKGRYAIKELWINKEKRREESVRLLLPAAKRQKRTYRK